MSLPTGQRHDMLSPFDARQGSGGPPRIYPLHLMEPNDWFALDNCPPQRAASIRNSVVNYRKKHPHARFTVRYCSELGPATVVCARLA